MPFTKGHKINVGRPSHCKGKKWSKEGVAPWNTGTKDVMIAWNKGIPMTKEEKLKDRLGHLGKKVSEETKQKMSISHKGLLVGENAPAWKGGIAYLPYAPDFNRQTKERVRVRDNFICQECGIPELELNKCLDIHHIDYNKKNSSLNNLICLCNKCHGKTHHNREYWTKHFNDKRNGLCQLKML
jgi:hypothetical protein